MTAMHNIKLNFGGTFCNISIPILVNTCACNICRCRSGYGLEIEAIGCVHLLTIDNCIYLFLNGKQKQRVTLEDPIKVNMVVYCWLLMVINIHCTPAS